MEKWQKRAGLHLKDEDRKDFSKAVSTKFANG